MQTWTREIGTCAASYGTVRVIGNAGQLFAWSHRAGARWPCSYLDDCDRVCAELDSRGDLVDLTVTVNGRIVGGDEIDIPADELTAWIDDNLAGTPFQHLRRGY
jgi:hypothetical protein